MGLYINFGTSYLKNGNIPPHLMQNSSYFLVVYLYCLASLSTPVIVLLVKVGAVLQTRLVTATLYQTKALSSKLCITQYLTTFCTVIVG